MTVDGGSLLYGLGEDENQRLTVLSPVELAGAPERIAQVVETSISEPPFIRIRTLPLPGDATKGYVVVLVPQSPRAPHQVISGSDMRYYGRGAKGNRVLSEAEVAALYGRRERWQVDRDALLREELARAPDIDPQLGYLLTFARPVVPDDSMIERVAASGGELLELLMKGARAWGEVRADRYGQRYDPDFRNAIHTWRRGVAGWSISTYREADDSPRDTAKLELDFDGTGHFFCGRVVDTMSTGFGSGTRVLFEAILASNLASFFGALGALYEAAAYVGQVDVGMALTGIEGTLPYGIHHWGENAFSGPPPQRTARVTAAEMRDDPKGIALSLIRRFLDATRGTTYSPFEET